MIPKKIHYIWLGRHKKPSNFKEVFSSWEKFASEYEVKEWNEDNCTEFELPPVFYTFLRLKKYAFASDVLRFYILKKYGGFYSDIDQVLVKPLDDFLDKELVFCKYHSRDDYYGFGLFGVSKNNLFVETMCHFFETDTNYTQGKQFTIINVIGSKVLNSLMKEGLTATILEQEYFHPEIENKWTDHTYAHHLSNTSWVVWYKKILYKLPYYLFLKKIVMSLLPKSIKRKIGFDITYK
jgi:mannosyltransferase OCH1-like enzyme